MMLAICTGSSMKLMGQAMPAVSAAHRQTCGSGVFGSNSATASVGPTPSERSKLAVCVMRVTSSAYGITDSSSGLSPMGTKRMATASGAARARVTMASYTVRGSSHASMGVCSNRAISSSVRTASSASSHLFMMVLSVGESGNARLRAPEDQRMHIVRGFVSVDGLEVHHVAVDLEFIRDAVAAGHVARDPPDLT